MPEIDYIELLGFITGVAGVWLAAKEISWNWPVGIINVCIYTFIFFKSQLYGDMGLQLFYIVIGFYGWYSWLKKSNTSTDFETHISKTPVNAAAYILITSLVGFFIVFFILKKAGSSVLVLDTITTVLSISATWMMAKKFIEHWFLWIFVDAVYIAVYIYKMLYLTAILYFVFVLLAIYGYVKWKKIMTQAQTNH